MENCPVPPCVVLLLIVKKRKKKKSDVLIVKTRKKKIDPPDMTTFSAFELSALHTGSDKGYVLNITVSQSSKAVVNSHLSRREDGAR